MRHLKVSIIIILLSLASLSVISAPSQAQTTTQPIYAISFRAADDTHQVAMLFDDATWQVSPVTAPMLFGESGRGYAPLFIPQWAGYRLVGTGVSESATEFERSYDYLYIYDPLTQTSELLSEIPLSSHFVDMPDSAYFRVGAVSPDGRYIFVTDDMHHLVINLATQAVITIEAGDLEVKAWHSDQVLVSSYDNNFVQVINLVTGEIGTNIADIYRDQTGIKGQNPLGWYFAEFLTSTQILIYDINNQHRGVWIFDLMMDELNLIHQDAHSPEFCPDQSTIAFFINVTELGLLDVDTLVFQVFDISHTLLETIGLVRLHWVSYNELIFWNTRNTENLEAVQVGHVTRAEETSQWELTVQTVYEAPTAGWYPLLGLDGQSAILAFNDLLGTPDGAFTIYDDAGLVKWSSADIFAGEAVNVVRFADSFFKVTEDLDWFFVSHYNEEYSVRKAIRWSTGAEIVVPANSYFVRSTPNHAWLLFEQCSVADKNDLQCQPDRLIAIEGATGREVILVEGLPLHNLVSSTDPYNRYIETTFTSD